MHDDVIKGKHFLRHWPFVRIINRWSGNFPHKGQWRGALMFSLISAWTNGWVNNRDTGDLRRHRGHCDVTVMVKEAQLLSKERDQWPHQGWGLLSRFPPFLYFANFSTSPKYMLAIGYPIHICQVLSQLSCGDTCQIWMWFEACNKYFWRSKILLTEKLTNGTLVTPISDLFLRCLRSHLWILIYITAPFISTAFHHWSGIFAIQRVSRMDICWYIFVVSRCEEWIGWRGLQCRNTPIVLNPF